MKNKLSALNDEDFDLEIYDYLVTLDLDGKPMTDIQRQVLATYIFDLEVKNGGLDQFYLNHAGKYIDNAIAGLKRFATPEFADIAEKSKEIYIHDEAQFRDRRNPALEPLDDKYYSLDHYLTTRVAFVKSNLDKIIF
ncbi:MAG: DUF4375 domain-containing protein [Chitinophagales bacterium]